MICGHIYQETLAISYLNIKINKYSCYVHKTISAEYALSCSVKLKKLLLPGNSKDGALNTLLLSPVQELIHEYMKDKRKTTEQIPYIYCWFTLLQVLEYLITIDYCYNYRMARNLCGTKFSRIGRWQRFCEKIFAVRRSQSTKHDDHKISRLKFSRSEANPRKPRKSCPAKISRHTVYTIDCMY